MESVDIVQETIVGLGDHRERPGTKLAELGSPLDECVANNAYAVGVGDHHGSVEEAGLLDPGGAGHFAIAVLGKPTAEGQVVTCFAARPDDGYACADAGLGD